MFRRSPPALAGAPDPKTVPGTGAGIPCLGGKTRRGLLYAKIMPPAGDDSVLFISTQ